MICAELLEFYINQLICMEKVEFEIMKVIKKKERKMPGGTFGSPEIINVGWNRVRLAYC